MAHLNEVITREDFLDHDRTKRFVHMVVDRMVSFCKDTFKFDDNWHIRYRRVTFINTKFCVSEGGIKFQGKYGVSGYVSFNLFDIHRKIKYTEYDHYKNDPFIGEIKVVDPRQYIVALIAHEVAHVVQTWFEQEKTSEQSNIVLSNYSICPKEDNGQDHGVFFQKIYTILRQVFVNNDAYKQFDLPEKRKQEPKIKK